MNIKQIPITQRPYEKLEAKGSAFLSESELLAIIIKTGDKNKTAIDLANEVLNLNKYSNKGLEFLNDISLNELTKIKGIGRVKAIQLKALGELLFRKSEIMDFSKIQIKNPKDIGQVFVSKLGLKQKEEFFLVILNKTNYIQKIKQIASGNDQFVRFSDKEILKEVLREDAQKIIFVHNHPSGEMLPSTKDIATTVKLKEKLSEFNIELVDHIIIGKDKFFSMKENLSCI